VQGNIAVFATLSIQRWLTVCAKQIHLSDMRDPSISNMQVCEKEMKIKAFSKEGLQAPQKDNPQERAKTEMRDNINKQVEQLETQVRMQ
jgi:CCR4-NOT transcriptional regulation complex NOT5 subunit